MTTPTNSHPSTLTKIQQSLKERPGLRYALVGVAMLYFLSFVIVPQLFAASSNGNVLQLVGNGIGAALIVTGMVTSFLKYRR
jgi:hypothetical protein